MDVVVLPELFAYDPYATLRASAERVYGEVCVCVVRVSDRACACALRASTARFVWVC